MRLVNHPPDTDTLEALLNEVRADGRYQADYTVAYDHSNNPSADNNGIDVLVTVVNKTTGPPFLDVGANVEAQTAGVTRATIESIFLWQDLGGYGSELRGNIKLGFLTELSAEYYRRLLNTGTSGGFFVAPSAGLRREPFYISHNQHRIAERELNKTFVGADLGWSNSRTEELRAGWELAAIRWRTSVGSDGEPDVVGNAQRGRIRSTFDSQDRALIPEFGIRSTTELSFLYNAVGSPNTPQFTTELSLAHDIGKNVFIFAAEGGTMLNRNVAQPFRFTLGGPLRLTASSIDEYRGTDYFLLEPAFLRRIAHLPAPLGQNIYIGGAYEVGQMHAPGTRTILRQDVYFGLIAETPLGAITVAPAIGDDGHRKFVFTLGKLF